MHRLLFILFASFCMNIAFGNDLLHTYSKIHFELENRNYDLDQCILKLKSSPPSDIYKNECSIVVSGQLDKSRALTEELEAKARKLVQDYQKNGLDKVTLLQIEDARNYLSYLYAGSALRLQQILILDESLKLEANQQ